MWRLGAAVLSLAQLSCPAAQKDDLPAGGSGSGDAATATVGEWVAVVMFLIIALVLSVVYAMKHKSDLGLDTLEHSTLVTSWSATPQRLLTVRCAIMVFMGSTVMFLIDPLHKGVAGVGDAFFCKFMPAVCRDLSACACVFLSLSPACLRCWLWVAGFTNWGYILLTAYFVSVVAYSLKYPATADTVPPPTGWQRALWLHFEVAGMSALFIDVVLWGILWPAAGFSGVFFQPLMVNVHFINLVMVGIEMSLNRIPVRKHHYFAVVGYTALYGLFATFEHVVLYDEARPWPYFFMDVEHLSYSVMLWYFCLLAIQAIFWLLLFKIDELKSKHIGGASVNETLMSPSETDSTYKPPTNEKAEPL